MSEDTEIDAGNYQGVAMNGAGQIVVLMPKRQMTSGGSAGARGLDRGPLRAQA